MVDNNKIIKTKDLISHITIITVSNRTSNKIKISDKVVETICKKLKWILLIRWKKKLTRVLKELEKTLINKNSTYQTYYKIEPSLLW